MKERTEVCYDQNGDLLEVFIGEPMRGYCEEMANGIYIRKEEKSGKTIGFMVLAFKRRLEKSLNLQYDKEVDVLHLRMGTSKDCYSKELGDEVFTYLDKKTGKTKGFTIVDFKKRLINLNFHDIPVEEPPLNL